MFVSYKYSFAIIITVIISLEFSRLY